MKKEDMIRKNQIIHLRTEREILINANNPWVVKLKYCFQDDKYLYLVMEFLPGGDFMSYLILKDILNEEEARFYIAEIILAVESLHKNNCIHRDLKPDNILIDKDGHLKLVDFGLSKLSDDNLFPVSAELEGENNKNSKEAIENTKKEYKKRNRLIAYSTVGTPDYIAPEVFAKCGYGFEVDFWSIGIIFFEVLKGFPPFYSDNQRDTCLKIPQWKRHFNIPSEPKTSIEADNLIKLLISPIENRIGLTFDKVKDHPFFKGFDWTNVRNMKPPFVPKLTTQDDLRYFEILKESPKETTQDKHHNKNNKRMECLFLDYNYNSNINNYEKEAYLDILETLEVMGKNSQKKNHIIRDQYNSQDNEGITIKESLKLNTKSNENSPEIKTKKIINLDLNKINILKIKLKPDDLTLNHNSPNIKDLNGKKCLSPQFQRNNGNLNLQNSKIIAIKKKKYTSKCYQD